ncbi:MAG TPA: helix-turn-helix domain containing protein [Candidatus Gemmiger excrementigallinarum]|uniref:Helix-turn-helix domain containing protein n=1 Tax=Candidatus Gemmiger excrementigallinarum TaxID=2838609 RepID=A0A9D2JA28_9FIRM|nr:helix-turn-helix domain containing protein [Candidatus Gemmiger excrementigallinarum]
MANRLTDRQKKKIVADYLELGSYNAVAKIHGVSRQTVKNIVTSDTEIGHKLQQKKAENTADILAYMESKRGLVCEILEKGLNVLNDEEKLREATPAQITTALGTLIDKWAAVSGSAASESREDDPITKSLKEEAAHGAE